MLTLLHGTRELLQTVRVAQMGLKLKENTLNMTETQHIPSESKVRRTFHAQKICNNFHDWE